MQDRKVKAEFDRLMALFDGVDENKVDFVREHLHQLAWYNLRIKELQKKIDENGLTIEFQNGRNQCGLQGNPDFRAMVDLQKLTNGMVKTLLPLVPEKQRKGGKLAMLRAQENLFDFEDDEDPEEKAEREREYEERRKKAEEDLQRAIEQQKREREQQNNQ